MQLNIGIIGDFEPNRISHTATHQALQHAAAALDHKVDVTWYATRELAAVSDMAELSRFDALWCAPGPPYQDRDAALRAIRFARENDWPFIGT